MSILARVVYLSRFTCWNECASRRYFTTDRKYSALPVVLPPNNGTGVNVKAGPCLITLRGGMLSPDIAGRILALRIESSKSRSIFYIFSAVVSLRGISKPPTSIDTFNFHLNINNFLCRLKYKLGKSCSDPFC